MTCDYNLCFNSCKQMFKWFGSYLVWEFREDLDLSACRRINETVRHLKGRQFNPAKDSISRFADFSTIPEINSQTNRSAKSEILLRIQQGEQRDQVYLTHTRHSFRTCHNLTKHVTT